MDRGWKGRLVLVTGAGGFIGSHLTETLLREGARVRAFLRYTSRNRQGLLSEIPLPSRENLLGTSGESRYVDKTAEPGKRYFYRVAARTKKKWRGEDASLEVHVPR